MIHFLYNYFLTRKPTKQKNRLSIWLNWQFYKYLKVHLVSYYKNAPMESLGINTNSNIVVSLTSFPARIDVVYLTIKSMLYQTKRPQKIVLWLGKEKFPKGQNVLPNSLLELIPLGLEIEFCEDIGAHTKYFYAFQKYPEKLIVTVDDDIIYPKNLLEILLETHNKYSNCVIANRVRYMQMENSNFKPYRKWKINRLKINNPSKRIIATGVGGVLYQPKFFLKSFFDVEGIRETNCFGDDIWLKAGQIENNVPVAFTNYYFKQFMEIPDSQKESLYATNVFEADNDRQIKEVFKYFGITENSFE